MLFLSIIVVSHLPDHFCTEPGKIMPCFVLNLQTVGQLKLMLWKNEISRDLSWRWVSDGYPISHKPTQPTPRSKLHSTVIKEGPRFTRQLNFIPNRIWPAFLRFNQILLMMTSSNGNIFRVTGPLCGEFTGHQWIPLTKASDADLWCFPRSLFEQRVE